MAEQVPQNFSDIPADIPEEAKELLLRGREKANEIVQEKHEQKVQTFGGFIAAGSFDLENLPTKYKAFELEDGRIVIMGPPNNAFVLSMPVLFRDYDGTALSLDLDNRMAKIIAYVRAIDKQVLPDPITSLDHVRSIVGQLGDLGYNQVVGIYQMHWPDDGRFLWKEVKKTSKTPSS